MAEASALGRCVDAARRRGTPPAHNAWPLIAPQRRSNGHYRMPRRPLFRPRLPSTATYVLTISA